jgi:hypothetical protein
MEDRPSEKAGDKHADKQRAIIAAAVDDQLERISELTELATESEDLEETRRPEASACRPRMPPTNFSATRLTWTGNSIVRWTSWSVCNDSAVAKRCRLLSISI